MVKAETEPGSGQNEDPIMERKKVRLSPLRRVCYALANTALLIVLCEAAARAAFPHLPQKPFQTRPGKKPGTVVHTFQLNQHGPAVVEPKPEGVFRVMVFGESAAEGWLGQGFPAWMERMAQSSDAGEKVEIINLAVPSTHSSAIRSWYFTAIEMGPDLVILYIGNNEIDWYSPANPKSHPLAFAALSRLRLHSRAFFLLVSFIHRQEQGFLLAGESLLSAAATMEKPILTKKRRERAMALYRYNLRDMIEAARSKSIPVVLVSPAANLRDWPPIKSYHHRELSAGEMEEFNGLLSQGEKALAKGEATKAAEILGAAVSLDPTFARSHYLLAKALEARRQTRDAYSQYQEARQWDDIYLRAPSSYIAVTRELAGETGALFIDLDRKLAAASPSGVAGFDFFIDGYHFKPRGNYEVARAIINELAGHGLWPPGKGPEPGFDVLLPSVMSRERISNLDLNRGLLLGILSATQTELLDAAIEAFDDLEKDLPGDPFPGLYKACLFARKNNGSAAARALSDSYRPNHLAASISAARFFPDILEIYQGQAVISITPRTRWSGVAARFISFRGEKNHKEIHPPPFGAIGLGDMSMAFIWDEKFGSFRDVTRELHSLQGLSHKMLREGEQSPGLDLMSLGLDSIRLKAMTAGGQWSELRADSSDSYLVITGIEFDPLLNPVLHIKASISSEEENENIADIYWAPTQNENFSEDGKISFPWPTDGKTRSMDIPMGRSIRVLMERPVKTLRIDFTSRPARITLHELRLEPGDE